jgi:hypothetical protein
MAVLGLLATLACAGCARPWTYAGCYPGGVDGFGNICSPGYDKVGAFSHVPFDGISD